MRARNLKPGFFKNEILCSLDPLARILFEGLWCIADRKGKLEDRPLRIKAEVLPYDSCDIENLLSILNEKGFINRYGNGEGKYIIIQNFSKHQTPHWQERDSILPDPDSPKRKPRVIQDKSKINPSDSLTPDSLTPDSLYSPNSDEFRLSELLFSFIQERDPKAKKPNLQKWADHVDKLIRIDKRTPEEIEAVIRWCQADNFECVNVLSTGKLRDRFSALKQKMERKPNEKKYGIVDTPSPFGVQ